MGRQEGGTGEPEGVLRQRSSRGGVAAGGQEDAVARDKRSNQAVALLRPAAQKTRVRYKSDKG